MATITSTSMLGPGQRVMTEVTLTGTADTFTYIPGKRQILIMRNATGGALSPIIDGNGGTTVVRDGVGSIDVSGGYAVGSIAAGAVRVIPLDTVSAYLQGVIAITGGTGLVCSLLSY
jgi:hypothetical protein